MPKNFQFVMGSTSDGVDRQYKCCFIPACYNTSVTTPEKFFFEVPQGSRREAWLKAAGLRVNKSAFLLTTRFFCCSDHFEFPQDIDGEGCLRKDVIPHKFRIPQKQTVPAKKEKRKWGNVVNVPIWIREEESTDGTHITNIFEPLVSLQESNSQAHSLIHNPQHRPTILAKKRRPHVHNVPIWVRADDHQSDEEVKKVKVKPAEPPVKRPRGRPRKHPKVERKQNVNVPIWIRGQDESSSPISSVIVQEIVEDPLSLLGCKIKEEPRDDEDLSFGQARIKIEPGVSFEETRIKVEPGVSFEERRIKVEPGLEENIFEPMVNLQEPIIKQEPPESPVYYQSEESDSYSAGEDGRTPVYCAKQTLNGKHVSYVISADNIRR